VGETSEVAGRSSRAPFVTQSHAELAPADGWIRRALHTALAYFHLTKPRVIELLLVTTLPAMILADGEMPSLGLIVAVLVGGALAAGGANTINCWIERDRDQIMRRTAHRPLPHGDVKPEGALVFGLVLEALAFALLWGTVNLLSATLAVSAMLFYVFVYTIWLKPRSPQNIVIGGAAGAVPVLVGWAAVTGELAAPAWVLFAIVFFWTPPHFWALSLKYYDDYEAAGIPMLPVAKGIPAAVRQIVGYSIVVVAITFTLPLTTDSVGVVYLVVAAVLGVLFVAQAIRLARNTTPAGAIRLFTYSNTYLALLFAAVAVDTLLRTV
jgi:protoheme IX farnesyltransferase